MSAKQLNLLFDEAAEKLGLVGARLDEAGACTIVSKYRDVPSVNIRYDAENDIVDIYAEVGAVGKESFFKELLKANFFGEGTRGAVFSLAPDSEKLVLAKELPVAAIMDATEFASAISNVMEVAYETRKRLTPKDDEEAAEDDEDEEPAAAPTPRPMSDVGTPYLSMGSEVLFQV